MKQWIANFLSLLLAISLLTVPANAISSPSHESPNCGMACCGPSCPCSTGKICAAVPATKCDRVTEEADREGIRTVSLLAAPVDYKQTLQIARSAVFADWDAKPPPLAVGGSAQAKLRVWLL